ASTTTPRPSRSGRGPPWRSSGFERRPEIGHHDSGEVRSRDLSHRIRDLDDRAGALGGTAWLRVAVGRRALAHPAEPVVTMARGPEAAPVRLTPQAPL